MWPEFAEGTGRTQDHSSSVCSKHIFATFYLSTSLHKICVDRRLPKSESGCHDIKLVSPSFSIGLSNLYQLIFHVPIHFVADR